MLEVEPVGARDPATPEPPDLLPQRSRHRHARRNPPVGGVLGFVGHELAPLLVVVFLATIELRHVARTTWLDWVLYNPDGVTLPLLRESLAHHEVWQPIMSTQLLAFPEGLLYAFSSALTTSIRASLVLNAYVNVLLLFGAARMVAGGVVPERGRRGRAAAVYTGALIVLMLLEVQPFQGQLQFATPLLVTTYYFGPLLGGVVLVACTIRQLRPAPGLLGNRPWALFAVGVTALTYGSDPLFLLWVTTPIVLTVLLLALVRRAPWRGALAVLGCQVVGLAIGSLLRMPFAEYTGASATSYLRLHQIGQAVSEFGAMVDNAWTYPSVRVEIVVVLLAFAAAAVQFVLLIRAPRRAADAPTGAALVVVTFALVAPVVDVVGVLASGNSTNRYYLPLVVFPLLAVLPLAGRFSSTPARAMPRTGLAVVVAVAALVGTVLVWPELNPLLDPADFAAGQCLARVTSIRGQTGVGDYWTSRPLEVYSSDNTHVLQVLDNLAPFAWLVNRGTFAHRTLTFVIVDTVIGPPSGVTAANTAPLGKPTSITTCPGFQVYTYPKGTHGYTVLNQVLDGYFPPDWPAHGGI